MRPAASSNLLQRGPLYWKKSHKALFDLRPRWLRQHHTWCKKNTTKWLVVSDDGIWEKIGWWYWELIRAFSRLRILRGWNRCHSTQLKTAKPLIKPIVSHGWPFSYSIRREPQIVLGWFTRILNIQRKAAWGEQVFLGPDESTEGSFRTILT